MQLAWSNPQLELCCASKARLRAHAGEQAAAAEDLLHVVSQAPRLENIESFQSIRIDVDDGNITLSLEDVDMYARPLNPDGVPSALLTRATLPKHSSSQALLIQDLYVRGRPILRLMN